MSETQSDYKRLELVWPGKKTQVERVKLPFQVIERVNDVRRSERGQAPLLGTELLSNWRNKLIWGDNKYVLASLLDEFAGKVDLIYIDPPFATGADFTYSVPIGDEDIELVKEHSAIEEKAYRDTWGLGIGSYIQMMYERLVLLRELLSEKGSVFVHCDWRVSHYLRLALEECFGTNFRNEIIWRRSTSHSDASRFGQVHDTIFWFAKSDQHHWDPQFGPYEQEYIDRYFRFAESDGKRYWKEDATGAGSGPPRRFGDRVVAPPTGRHWRWTQDTIDAYWAKERLYLPEPANLTSKDISTSKKASR
jgi:adenine-specific DNA-methyltransferase